MKKDITNCLPELAYSFAIEGSREISFSFAFYNNKRFSFEQCVRYVRMTVNIVET